MPDYLLGGSPQDTLGHLGFWNEIPGIIILLTILGYFRVVTLKVTYTERNLYENGSGK